MRVLGLTGSMGAGKTYVANLFRRAGWPVFDADAHVHLLQMRRGAAVEPIAARWPEVVQDGCVDRAALRRAVIGHPEEIRALEAIMHPLVRAARAHFIKRARARGASWCVLDIPLLLETGANRECDCVLVVTAPASLRLKRVMSRRSIDETQARTLMARQMPDAEKRHRADMLIYTGLSRGATIAQVKLIRRALEVGP